MTQLVTNSLYEFVDALHCGHVDPIWWPIEYSLLVIRCHVRVVDSMDWYLLDVCRIQVFIDSFLQHRTEVGSVIIEHAININTEYPGL